MRVSFEMLSVSPDGLLDSWPNKLLVHRERVNGRDMVFVTVEAVHDGHKVVSTVSVEAGVFRYHVTGSGVLS